MSREFTMKPQDVKRLDNVFKSKARFSFKEEGDGKGRLCEIIDKATGTPWAEGRGATQQEAFEAAMKDADEKQRPLSPMEQAEQRNKAVAGLTTKLSETEAKLAAAEAKLAKLEKKEKKEKPEAPKVPAAPGAPKTPAAPPPPPPPSKDDDEDDED